MNNNKGMTLVELIVTFSLLLVIVVGLYRLILDIRLNYEEKDVTKSFTEYSAMVSSEIQYKLLKMNASKDKISVSENKASINGYVVEINTDDKIGVTYGGVFEPIPNVKFAEFERDNNTPYVKLETTDNNSYLIINFPIYSVQNDDPENYGFKIVYPVS
ncbi:MAG: prepilin-type N-terminal cleavage/methylation domain-containing protein [bacterium]|nr:prepilin-type N-terminal cleavage/methylation domain-containing protein [bacterium]